MEMLTQDQITLRDTEWLRLLKIQRARLDREKGRPLLDDCDLPGAKSLTSNVGMCDMRLGEFWPRVECSSGLASRCHKGKAGNHWCPLDTRGQHIGDIRGCFYSCLLRKRAKRGQPQVRISLDALRQLYDEVIAEFERQITGSAPAAPKKGWTPEED